MLLLTIFVYAWRSNFVHRHIQQHNCWGRLGVTVLSVSTQTSWYFLIHNEIGLPTWNCCSYWLFGGKISIRYSFSQKKPQSVMVSTPFLPPLKNEDISLTFALILKKMQGMILKKVLILNDNWTSLISVIMFLLNPYIVLEEKYIAASGHVSQDAWVIWYISKYRWLTFVSQIVSITCSCILFFIIVLNSSVLRSIHTCIITTCILVYQTFVQIWSDWVSLVLGVSCYHGRNFRRQYAKCKQK